MSTIISHQANENQNPTEVPLHIHQDEYNKKKKI